MGMGTIVAIASVVLALIAGGCIAYIAWEITDDKNIGKRPDRSGSSRDD